jgi:hypothetical protein
MESFDVPAERVIRSDAVCVQRGRQRFRRHPDRIRAEPCDERSSKPLFL